MDVRVSVHLDRAEPAGAQVGDGTELRLAIGRRSSAAAIVDQRRWVHVPGPALDAAAADPKLAPFGVAVVDPTGRISDRQHRIAPGEQAPDLLPVLGIELLIAPWIELDAGGGSGVVHAQYDGPFQVEPSGRPPARQQRQAQDGAQLRRRGDVGGIEAADERGQPRSRRRATIGVPSRVAHTASPVTWRAATTTGSSRRATRPDHPLQRPAADRAAAARTGEHGPERIRGLRAVAARPESPHPSRRL